MVYKHEDIDRHHLHIVTVRVDGDGRSIDLSLIHIFLVDESVSIYSFFLRLSASCRMTASMSPPNCSARR